jgi:hypothetical protein
VSAPFGRLNPADPDYQLQKLTGAQSVTAFRVARTEADSHQPDQPFTPPSVADMVEISPLSPRMVRYTSASFPTGLHKVTIPVSTLMQPSTANPRLLHFPTIST